MAARPAASRVRGLALATGCAVAGAACAQSAETVVVTATRNALDLADAPAASSVVARETLDLRNVFRLGDALAGLPGVLVRGSALGESFPASGAGILSLRGLPRTARTLVLLDGAPLNNALSGAVNASGLAMQTIERVEVVRGPFSALYGGHAMGGVVQLFSAVPERRERYVQVGAGAGDVPRSGYAVGLRDRLDTGLGLAFFAGYRRSDGWDASDLVVKTPLPGRGALVADGADATCTPDGRPAWLVGDKGARPWEQSNVSLSLHHAPLPGWSLAAGVAWSRSHVGATPPRTRLRDADGREVLAGDLQLGPGGPRIALAERDFLTQTPSGESELRVHGRAEIALGARAALRLSASWLDAGFRFPQPGPTATYAAGPGELVDQPSQRADADAHLRIEASDTLALTLGVSAHRSSLDRSTWRLASWRDAGTRTEVLGTGEGTTRAVAVYGEAQWQPARWLALYGGLRYDHFVTAGRTTQREPPAFDERSPERAAAQWSPKVAAVAALGPRTSLRLSYGEGFRAPTLLDLYSRSAAPGPTAGAPIVTEASPQLAPERVRSVEAGLDVSLPARGRLAVSLYAQRLTDLIYRQRASPLRNVIVNAGEARVDGVEFELAQPLPDERLRLLASATHLFRYDLVRNDAVPASVGRRLTDVPRVLYAVALEGRSGVWSGSLAWRHAGHAFGSGDDLNLGTVQGVFGAWDRHDVVGLKLARDLGGGAVLSVAVDNVLDARYFQFYRQPGRSVYFELTARW